MYYMPSRISDDGPDLDDRVVFVTCCHDCGWEDPKSHETRGDCTIDKCPACGSEYLLDEEQTEEFMR